MKAKLLLSTRSIPPEISCCLQDVILTRAQSFSVIKRQIANQQPGNGPTLGTEPFSSTSSGALLLTGIGSELSWQRQQKRDWKMLRFLGFLEGDGFWAPGGKQRSEEIRSQILLPDCLLHVTLPRLHCRESRKGSILCKTRVVFFTVLPTT